MTISPVRATAHYALAFVVMTLHGGEVCPLIATLPSWSLGLVIAIPLVPAFLLRRTLNRRYVDPAPAAQRSGRQFKADLALLLAAALAVGLINMAVFSFPFFSSGLKLVAGFTALGVFAATDLALERERAVIHEALRTGTSRTPPSKLTSLTRKFLLLAAFIMALTTAVLLSIVLSDLNWIASARSGRIAIPGMERAMTREIVFVMAVLLAEAVNLTLSYSRNLKLLFNNQTTVLARVSDGDLNGFVPAVTNDELGFIAGHTNLMIDGLKDRSRLAEGMAVAREIQLNLLPGEPPQVPGLDIAGASVSSDETGGDYYDFIYSRERDVLTTLVGDVSGHGVGAALLMASARASIRLRDILPGTPSERLGDVNRMLFRDTNGSGRFMTLFILTVHLEDNSLSYLSAGHDPAMAYNPEEDAFDEFRGEGLPLGVVRESTYPVFTRKALGPGEIVLLGTDGIWEARAPNGSMFGKDRVREILRRNSHAPARGIVRALLDAVGEFRENGPRTDDVTMVVLKRVSSPAPQDTEHQNLHPACISLLTKAIQAGYMFFALDSERPPGPWSKARSGCRDSPTGCDGRIPGP